MNGGRRDERRARRVLRRMDRDAARAARRQARRSGAGAGTLLVVVVVAAVLGVLTLRSGWDPNAWLRPRAYVEVDGQAVAVPRPSPSEGRLLPAVPVATEGPHVFLHTHDDGTPVGYDPCRPVRYVIRPDGMPDSGHRLIEESIAVISAATGLALEYAGTTDEPPAVERPLIQPDRYGDGWAPVLVAWSGPTQTPELAGEVAGIGGSAAVPGASGKGLWLAAGRVVLDTADITSMLGRSGGWAEARAIVVHELAHVVGLDHVSDPAELMYAVSSVSTDLGPGDRQGLALVGQVACEG